MHWTPSKIAALTALLALSACGGGGSETATKFTFTSLVSFGDSLSDVGTYKVGTVAAIGGGKFTVNGTTGPANWTELLAAQLNLAAPCPAQTGLLSNLSAIPLVPVADHAGCTNYAQGSARVTSPLAPRSAALQALGSPTIGLMAQPVKDQIASHLARVGSFSGTELVTVLAGANDVFMHLTAVNAVTTLLAADSVQNRTLAYGAALAAGWSTTIQANIQNGTPAATLAAAAPTEAVTGIMTAATQLDAYLQASVLGKGAKYVVVVNVPNIVQTPLGQSLSASGQTLLGTLVSTFNSTLKTNLPASVLLADAYTQGMDQYANPAQYGLTNVTTPVCSADPTKNILLGYSLGCNLGNLVAGVDINTYQFADDIHPTPAGYKLLNRYVALRLAQQGWL